MPDRDSLNIPRNPFEYSVLAYLMLYINDLIKAEFKEEWAETIRHFRTRIPSPKQPRNHQNLNDDHLKMADEVNAVIKKFGKSYELKVIQFILPGEEMPNPSTITKKQPQSPATE